MNNGKCTKCGSQKVLYSKATRLLFRCKPCFNLWRRKQAALGMEKIRYARLTEAQKQKKRDLGRESRKIRELNKPKYAERKKAHRKVSYAIATGKLKRLPCEVCGKLKVHAHHPRGYDEKHIFDIQWLCQDCHFEEHRSIKSAKYLKLKTRDSKKV